MSKQNFAVLRRLGAFAFLLSVATLTWPGELQARSILAAGESAVWKYRVDTDSELAADWTQPNYDDSGWKSGKAPLGFGEARIGTAFDKNPITAWFRHEIDASGLKSGEGLVVLICADDGMIVYLNGKEVGRTNMPEGTATATTQALDTIGDDEEGHYHRLHVPADALHSGEKNVLAVEVHNVSARSSDFYFDLALKTFPAERAPKVDPASAAVAMTFNKQHYLGPEVGIPDGYIDGGRKMKVDASGNAESGREILAVDRAHDAELAPDLAFARSTELRALPEMERAQRIAEWIDRATTPPGGLRCVDKSVDELESEFEGKALLIGDWVDQCQAGVCRHRSLLFKILADEAGLKTALVRGNFLEKKPPGFPHAWNELFLADGRRVIVDVMHEGGKPKFRAVTEPYVVWHYRKVDDAPWYGDGAEAKVGP